MIYIRDCTDSICCQVFCLHTSFSAGCSDTASSTWHPVEQRQHLARWSSSRSPAPPCCTPPSSAPPPAIHTPGFRCSGFPALRRLLGSGGNFLGQCSRGWEGTDCGSSRSDQGQ